MRPCTVMAMGKYFIIQICTHIGWAIQKFIYLFKQVYARATICRWLTCFKDNFIPYIDQNIVYKCNFLIKHGQNLQSACKVFFLVHRDLLHVFGILILNASHQLGTQHRFVCPSLFTIKLHNSFFGTFLLMAL